MHWAALPLLHLAHSPREQARLERGRDLSERVCVRAWVFDIDGSKLSVVSDWRFRLVGATGSLLNLDCEVTLVLEPILSLHYFTPPCPSCVRRCASRAPRRLPAL